MDDRHVPRDRRAAFLRLLQYLRPHGAALALGISANIGLGLVALVPPLLYGRITDDVILAAGATEARIRLLVILALLLAAVYGLNSLLAFARGYVMHVLGESSSSLCARMCTATSSSCPSVISTRGRPARS